MFYLIVPKAAVMETVGLRNTTSAAEISPVTCKKEELRKTDIDYSALWCWYIVVKSFIVFEL